MRPYSLMIARFPGNFQEHPASSGYVIDLIETLHNDDRIGKIRNVAISDTPITMSRNRAVRTALEERLDYILMIDSDMYPDCEPAASPFWDTAWDFMMERRKAEEEKVDALLASYGLDRTREFSKEVTDQIIKIRARYSPATVAAPYCGPPPHEQVYVFRWDRKPIGDAEHKFKLEKIGREEAASKTGIEEVAALPTGLILYDTRTFKKLPAPWFDYEWLDEFRTEKASTEDVFQTRNASIIGLPQYVVWDCWAAHIKSKFVGKPKPLTLLNVRDEYAKALRRMDSSGS